MIIGCKFIQSYQTKSFENSFIDLIHGDIIDADGLDYACRDAWASGYCTNNIDVDRLIDSIHIEKTLKIFILYVIQLKLKMRLRPY